MGHLRQKGLRVTHLLAKRVEELGNQVKVVVGALNTGMAHVFAEVWEHNVKINADDDPSVQIPEREVMPEVVCPGPIAASLVKAGGFPYVAKNQTYA